MVQNFRIVQSVSTENKFIVKAKITGGSFKGHQKRGYKFCCNVLASLQSEER